MVASHSIELNSTSGDSLNPSDPGGSRGCAKKRGGVIMNISTD